MRKTISCGDKEETNIASGHPSYYTCCRDSPQREIYTRMLSDAGYLYNYFLTSVEVLKPRGVQSLLSLIHKVWVRGSGNVITVPLEFITVLGCNVRAPPTDSLVTWI